MYYTLFFAIAALVGLAKYSTSPSEEALAHKEQMHSPPPRHQVASQVPKKVSRRFAEQWWKSAVIYHIYLRSFSDANNDGIGDLKGLISKLDYLSDTLGIDAIWLSPIHPSPDKDFGYDVADYYGIHQDFGTMADFDELVQECKRREIKIILDLVVNHTSDEHPWFKESRQSLDNPKRDWYLWRESDGPWPPNNWQARPAGGGSAWKFDEVTKEWYMRSFFDSQPDLNWRNKEVRKEVKKIMNFWLEKGVAGFRLDIANYYLKDERFRDNPVSMLKKFAYGTCLGYEYQAQEHIYDKNNPDLITIFRKMRKTAEPYNAILIGEIDDEEGHLGNTFMSSRAYGPSNDGLHCAFNFDLLKTSPDASSLRKAVENWHKQLPEGAQPIYALSNHDKERLFSRLGASENLAKLVALWQLTSQATPVIYYGDEIGMRHSELGELDSKDALYSMAPKIIKSFMKNRDGARTPMPWTSGAYAGFSESCAPWLPLQQDDDSPNVQEQLAQSDSLLSLYQRILRLRKDHPVLSLGDFQFLPSQPKILVYKRNLGRNTLIVALNFANEVQKFALSHATCLFSTEAHCQIKDEEIMLRPFEGAIVSQYATAAQPATRQPIKIE